MTPASVLARAEAEMAEEAAAIMRLAVDATKRAAVSEPCEVDAEILAAAAAYRAFPPRRWWD